MEEGWTQWKDNRQPPISGVITAEAPTDLTGVSTVKLQMRAVDSSTLDVDAAAVIDVATAQRLEVHYNWAAADVDTAGFYAAWWRSTLASGQFHDSPEFLVWVRSHAPMTGQYVSLEEFKQATTMHGEGYADMDIVRAIVSASRIVDNITCRGSSTPQGFTSAPASTQTFSPVSPYYLRVGPVSAITAVTVNGQAWTQGTHYYVDGGDTLRVLNGSTFFRSGQSVSVTADFGYAAVPSEVKDATIIIAEQLVRRVREAPFGVLATSIDGPSIRLGRYDPQVEALLARYVTSGMIE